MCFYGSNVVLHHAFSSLQLPMQLRMNCFDDLFVPTDYVLMFSHLQVFIVQCMFDSSILTTRLVI